MIIPVFQINKKCGSAPDVLVIVDSCKELFVDDGKKCIPNIDKTNSESGSSQDLCILNLDNCEFLLVGENLKNLHLEKVIF